MEAREQPIKLWTTEIWAVNHARYHDPLRGFPVKWQGPHVPGRTLQDAQEYCNKNGLGYCRVYGMLVEEGYIDTVLDSQN